MFVTKKHVIFLYFLVTNTLFSQELYWTGNGGDANFFNESNWANIVSGQPPESGSINPSQPINFDLLLSCEAHTTSTEVTNIASQTPHIFNQGITEPWPYVYNAAIIGDGNNGAEQTFVINVTDLPSGSVNYRVNKTVSNGNWSQGNSQALSLGINTITVSSVDFERTVNVQFSSGAVNFDSISLNENIIYSLPNSSIVLESSKTLQISNGVLDAYSFSGGTLILNENSYVHLSGNTPLLEDIQVYINSNMSWLRLNNVTPTLAYDNYLSQFFVFDDYSEYPTNIRLDNYYDNGVVVRAQNFEATPLTIYSNENLNGSEASIIIDQIYSGASIPTQMNDNIRSFYLKRGHMLTLAVNEDGTGKSNVYIASEEDLEIHTLPNSLLEGISFVRVIPWNWVSKKGTAGDIVGMDNTWFYRWSNNGLSDMQRECPPMSWGFGGANDDGDISLYRSIYKSTHVLGFNEPDDCNGQSGQYNNLCDVNVALGIYENLMKTGLRLVSPACRQGAAFEWLNTFNQQAIQNDIRIDVIAVHWYDWGGNPQNSPNVSPSAILDRFSTYLNEVYNLYGLPIWITEFNGNKYRSTEVNRQFMELAIPYLESLNFVERYAWFEPQNVTIPEDPGNAEFYDDAMNLTDIGLFYKNHQSTPSIPVTYYVGPNNLNTEVVVNQYVYSCDPTSSLSFESDIYAQKASLKVIPNPATNKIKLLFSEPIYSIKLYNINGLRIQKELESGYIDVSDLSEGVYFISVNHSHFKFLKQ
jgi:hypothetical protein